MRQAGKKQIEITNAIGFNQSVNSKELSGNRGERGYRPAQADRLAKERKSGKRTRPKVMVGIIKKRSTRGSGLSTAPIRSARNWRYAT
jgi:hypothetical protein